MTVYVVVEGPGDEALFEWLLSDISKTKRVKLVAGGGKSSAVSLARSLLVRDRRPLALMLDADTHNPKEVEARSAEYEYALAEAARSIPTTVQLVAPSVEAIIFDDEPFVERAAKKGLSADEKFTAKFLPKPVLETLFPLPALANFVKAARKQPPPKAMLTHSNVQALREFILRHG